jgi:pimeloyl-ACP methyl ester carboxylesterase
MMKLWSVCRIWQAGCGRLGWLRLALICGLLPVVFPAFAAPVTVPNVALLIHGTNSDPATWNDFVNQVYAGDCPILRLGVAPSTVSRCYRVQFTERTVDGVAWRAGDGATFTQLRNEVRAAFRSLLKRVNPARVILVGHSRGGLVARAYLQDLPTAQTFKLGLVTLGTPHQGTPFGRVGAFMHDRGASPDEVVDELRFIFSPSVRYQATAFDSAGNPVRSTVSEAIFALNDDIANLSASTASVGYLQSSGLRLGENAYNDFDILDGVGAQLLSFLSPGSFDRLLRFVLDNIVPVKSRPVLPDTWSCRGSAAAEHPWACDGDGIVPTASQKLDQVSGFVNNFASVPRIELSKIKHTQQTGRITEIRSLIAQVRRGMNR